MKFLRKCLVLSGKVILGLILFIALYLGSAYVLSRIATDTEPVVADGTDIFIITNGVHTDLVLPIKTKEINWSDLIPFSNTTGKDTLMKYVAFGWGDRGFYLETPTWADLKVTTAFKAAFSLGSSALHTTFYKRIRESDTCKRITLSNDQYRQLVKYIRETILMASDGKAIYIDTNANYGQNDAFYEALGSYNLFHTCNTWANDGLKSCGQKASLWTPFDTGIFYHYTEK